MKPTTHFKLNDRNHEKHEKHETVGDTESDFRGFRAFRVLWIDRTGQNDDDRLTQTLGHASGQGRDQGPKILNSASSTSCLHAFSVPTSCRRDRKIDFQMEGSHQGPFKTPSKLRKTDSLLDLCPGFYLTSVGSKEAILHHQNTFLRFLESNEPPVLRNSKLGVDRVGLIGEFHQFFS